ncbi:MAG: beta-Ig-H3/fasciclin [Promethearchaeota archaeon CR_4]|nr:MAG: beta-Ig-H3/fasciclin [Candidatus Lokiarchaeota archaeon CR_4]
MVRDIIEVAGSTKGLSIFVQAVKAAGLEEKLRSKGPFTVFAPTDDAFKKIPAGMAAVESLLKNKQKLTTLLYHHILTGQHSTGQLANVHTVKTVQGEKITIDVVGGKVKVMGAKLMQPDIRAQNGVIHAIDTVILNVA